MNEKTNWKVVTLIVSVLIIAVTSVICAVVMRNKNGTPSTSASASSEDSSSYTRDSSSVNSNSSSSEEKKLIYADSEGNTYEFIKIVDSKDGRQLVIFQNTETGTVSMALKSYFDEHYHIING